jgi:hypothetical protein
MAQRERESADPEWKAGLERRGRQLKLNVLLAAGGPVVSDTVKSKGSVRDRLRRTSLLITKRSQPT